MQPSPKACAYTFQVLFGVAEQAHAGLTYLSRGAIGCIKSFLGCRCLLKVEGQLPGDSGQKLLCAYYASTRDAA